MINRVCDNCIHYDVCLLHEDNFIDDVAKNGFCGKFRSKDVVEVIRCKDCKYCEDYDIQDEYGWYHCAMHDMPTKLDHFCNFGERSDT